MLYLTSTASALTHDCNIVYDAMIEKNGMLYVRLNPSKSYRACIIDIDEHEACVLALKGTVLFKILEITPLPFADTITLFSYIATAANKDAVAEYHGVIY